MKSLIFFLLCCIICMSCSANAQTVSPKKETIIKTPSSCVTAAPFCESDTIALASNILMNEHSFLSVFKSHEVIYGRTWNCFAIYEGENLIYFGDGDAFWLDRDKYVIQGGAFKATIDLPSGEGILEEPGRLKRELKRPVYNGKCAREDWQITQAAN